MASDATRSNEAARDTWERKAVGEDRATAEAGTLDYFDQIRAYRYGYETPFIPRVFDFSSLAGKRVLEIGVGIGTDAVEMMRHGAIYSGLDITRNHLDLTRRNIALRQQNGEDLRLEQIVEGDLMETSLPGNYDVIYSFGVLHHIAHEGDYLRKIAGLLRPGGELRVAVYSKFSFFNAYLTAAWAWKQRDIAFDDFRSHVAELSEIGNPVTIKIRSRRQVQGMLEEAGFEVRRYARRGFVQNYLPVVGKKLKPDGPLLNGLGSLLGWYHCFICSVRGEPGGQT